MVTRGMTNPSVGLPDGLRLAVRDALCRGERRKKEFKEAVFSLEATEGPIGRQAMRCDFVS